MTRLLKFYGYEDHPWLRKDFAKLSSAERLMCITFIKQHEPLGRPEFAELVNRWFLDNPNKPKNWTVMVTLVASTNSG